MRFKGYIAILLLAVTACAEKKVEEPVKAPENLIPENELIGVIIDLQLLESQYQFRYQRPDVYKNALDSASYYVYEKHGVTEDQFVSSYDYYALNIDKMFLIYEAALDSVNLLIAQPQQ